MLSPVLCGVTSVANQVSLKTGLSILCHSMLHLLFNDTAKHNKNGKLPGCAITSFPGKALRFWPNFSVWTFFPLDTTVPAGLDQLSYVQSPVSCIGCF